MVAKKKYILIRQVYLIIFLSIVVSFSSLAEVITNNEREVQNFVGREAAITNLYNKVISNQKKSVFVYGESGIGKTQAVQKFVRNNKNNYQIVWWIDSLHNLEFQYFQLTKALSQLRCNIDTDDKFQTFSQVVKNINKCSDKTLIIFDNVSSAQYISPFIKTINSSSKLQGLYISQVQISAEPEDNIEISKLSNKESIKYIKSYLGDRENNRNIKKLASILDGNPTLLEQAISYILFAQNNDIMSYIDLINNHTKELFSQKERRLDFKNKYSLSAYEVIRLPILKIKDINNNAFNLLKSVSFLSDQIDDKTLMKIYFSGQKDVSQIKYSKSVSLIYNYRIMSLKQNKNSSIHSIHSIKQNILREDFGDNDSLMKVIKVLSESMPSNIGKLTAEIEANHLKLDNMQIVGKHIIKRKLINTDSIQFLIKLMSINNATYQYDNTRSIIDFISSNVTTNELVNIITKDDVVRFEILKGRYFRDKKFELKESLECFERARNLLNINTPEELRYLALAHSAYTMMKNGQAKEAIKLTLDSNKIFRKDLSFLPLYLRLNTEMYIESGEYEKVLDNLHLAINSYDTKSEKRRLFEYIPLVEVLIRVNKLDEAKRYLDKCLKIIKEEDLFTNNKQYIELLMVQIKYNLAVNNIKIANTILSLVENMLSDIEENFSKNKAEEYKAELSIIKGDIKVQEKDALQAITYYTDAEKTLVDLYNNVVEKRKFAELYEKIVLAALSLRNLDIANKYYLIQLGNFGYDYSITSSIRKLLAKEKIRQLD